MLWPNKLSLSEATLILCLLRYRPRQTLVRDEAVRIRRASSQFALNLTILPLLFTQCAYFHVVGTGQPTAQLKIHWSVSTNTKPKLLRRQSKLFWEQESMLSAPRTWTRVARFDFLFASNEKGESPARSSTFVSRQHDDHQTVTWGFWGPRISANPKQKAKSDPTQTEKLSFRLSICCFRVSNRALPGILSLFEWGRWKCDSRNKESRNHVWLRI